MVDWRDLYERKCAEFDELRETSEELETEQEAEITDLHGDRRRLNETIDQLRAEYSQLRTELARSEKLTGKLARRQQEPAPPPRASSRPSTPAPTPAAAPAPPEPIDDGDWTKDELWAEISELERDLAAEMDRNDELSREMDETNGDLMRMIAYNEQTSQQLEAGTDALRSRSAEELVRLQKEHAEDTERFERDIEELQGKLTSTQKRLDDALSEIADLRDKGATATSTTSELEAQIEKLKAHLHEAEQESTKHREVLLVEETRELAEVEQQYKDELQALQVELKAAQAASEESEQAQVDAAEKAAAERDELMARISEVEESLQARDAESQHVEEELASRAQAVSALEEENQQLRTRLESEVEDFQDSRALIAELKERVEEKEVELRRLRSQKRRERPAVVAAPTGDANASESGAVQVVTGLPHPPEYYHELDAMYKAEVRQRRQYFDQLQSMKGNIRVYCRVRVMLGFEKERGALKAVEFPGQDSLTILNEDEATAAAAKVDDDDSAARALVAGGRGHSFAFDRVFGPHHDQGDVYKECEGLIESTLDGYNVCIFAYGQTGSGKTYTMNGAPGKRGIIYRALGSLFTAVRDREAEFDMSIRVSFLEIYNENLVDLLAGEAGGSTADSSTTGGDGSGKADDIFLDGKLKIVEAKDGSGTTVLGANEFEVDSRDEVLTLFNKGMDNRATSSTSMNEHSSRSHMVISILVTAQSKLTDEKTVGKLYFADLAGSERVKASEVEGARLKEAQHINKSLSALGDVMNALAARSTSKSGSKAASTHIPYRNSKLTYLLRDSLGGNSRTLMFVNVSPASYNGKDTLQSLLFAKRVKSIKLGAASSNRESELTQQLKKQLQSFIRNKETLETKLKSATDSKAAQEEKVSQQVATVQEKARKLRAANAALRAELEAALRGVDRASKMGAKDVEDAEKRLQSITKERDDYKRKTTGLEKRLAELSSTSERMEADLGRRAAQISSRDKRQGMKLKELERKIEDAQRKAGQAESAKQKAEEELKELKLQTASDMMEKKRDISELQAKISQQKAQLRKRAGAVAAASPSRTSTRSSSRASSNAGAEDAPTASSAATATSRATSRTSVNSLSVASARERSRAGTVGRTASTRSASSAAPRLGQGTAAARARVGSSTTHRSALEQRKALRERRERERERNADRSSRRPRISVTAGSRTRSVSPGTPRSASAKPRGAPSKAEPSKKISAVTAARIKARASARASSGRLGPGASPRHRPTRSVTTVSKAPPRELARPKSRLKKPDDSY